MSPPIEQPVTSPCQAVCRLSQDGSICIGCGRTLDEIGRWSQAGLAEQQEIARLAAVRLALREKT
ncbi:DUF1289 domain-containing protein [Parasphingopyxis sp.]|uniref:DUF1289 domain-containing protein n=1 Tax=Parasphingopyxis sp. TaxID=1920299 RepID=UPI002608A5D1|nr:DUF1289 domain-containing protein [Parasphingopyxis sp.]